MSEQWITIIVAILGSGAFVALVNAVINRRKSKAETESINIQASSKIMEEYRQQFEFIEKRNDRLTERISNLESELEVQAATIENLNAQRLKDRLIISILVMQFRSMGYEPVIPPEKIDFITVEEVQDIAAAMSRAEVRRDELRSAKGEGGEQ